MIRSSLMLAAALALAACGPTGTVASAGSSPADTAPSTSTAPAAPIDAKAIVVAFEALDTAATAADILVTTHAIQPGSPRALQIANGLAGAKTWLTIASNAQRAARATDYLNALTQAAAALAGAQAALKGN